MHVKIERIYTKPASMGYRVLVDRLWPRGISKVDAKLDLWAKDIAPSTALRQWFQHDPDKFATFRQRYREELAENPAVPELITTLKSHEEAPVILLYGAKDETDNQAVVLAEFLADK